MSNGKLKPRNNIFLAPMAGITDSAFRRIAVDFGCGLVFTEMVNARGLVEGSRHSWRLMEFKEEESPIGLQIFGSDPGVMAEAACLGVEYGYDFIDINMGCPTPKIVKNGEGAALMKDLNLSQKILESVTGAVNVPVTLKMRKGWSEKELTALSLAEIAQDAGIYWITIHSRTWEQFYTGRADWSFIKEIKKKVNIPVIGNGDLKSPDDCKKMFEETGCDGIMIGRGALGSPWIFRQACYYLKEGKLLPQPDKEEIINTAFKHLELICELKGEDVGVREMRKHAAWYIKGIRGAGRIRKEINTCRTIQEMESLLKNVPDQGDF